MPLFDRTAEDRMHSRDRDRMTSSKDHRPKWNLQLQHGLNLQCIGCTLYQGAYTADILTTKV